MIISELNHLETVVESKEIVGGTSIDFSVFNKTDLSQYAKSSAKGGKVTVGKGDVYANVTATATNCSYIDQANKVEYVAIDP